MLFFLGLHGFTSTAQGAMALVGDKVCGMSRTPPLEDIVGLVGAASPNAREPASRNVEPGSLTTELDCEDKVCLDDLDCLVVSTERMG